MSDNTVVSFSNPAFRDELTDLVRAGAQRTPLDVSSPVHQI